MIDLEADEGLELLRDTARKFAEEELQPRMRGAERARTPDAEASRAYAGIGLSGLELPEAAGGAGLGARARVLVNEELAAGDAGAALALDPFGPALYPLLEMGAEPLSLSRLGALPGGRLVLATHLDGPVQVDAEAVAAQPAWVPAERVGGVVVLDRRRAALVTEGVEVTALRGAGLRAAGAGALALRSARPELVCEGASGAGRALARARLYVASLLLGGMRAACDFASAYAQQREAFGRPIAHHQALAFLITDMHIALEGARLLVHEAAWRVDSGLSSEAAAASAFAQCIEAARAIGPNAVQILGGHGFVTDYPVEKHMRELRALGLLLGGLDAAVEEAGRAVCASPAPLGLGVPEAL